MPASTDPAAPATVRSVDRAFDILELLERADRPLRLVDLSRGASLHAATVLRIVAVLQRKGLVVHEAGEYRMGAATLGMAHRYLQSDPLVARARPHLQHLAARTGLSASLYVRLGDERILVARVDGLEPLRYELPLGRRLPLGLGAGRSILAFLDEHERDALVQRVVPVRTADGAELDAAALQGALERVRSDGFHISVSERDVGVAAISVPVLDAEGAVVAALSVVGPEERDAVAQLQGHAPALRRAAHAIAH